jgi:periplasmic divalent cation tolerance protein
MAEEALLVFSTFPTAEAARTAVRTLVEERLCACGNLMPKVESIYRWEGRVETAEEVLIVLKTTRLRYPAVEESLRAMHPYEVPEIIAVRLENGAPAYLKWIADSCSAD